MVRPALSGAAAPGVCCTAVGAFNQRAYVYKSVGWDQLGGNVPFDDRPNRLPVYGFRVRQLGRPALGGPGNRAPDRASTASISRPANGCLAADLSGNGLRNYKAPRDFPAVVCDAVEWGVPSMVDLYMASPARPACCRIVQEMRV